MISLLLNLLFYSLPLLVCGAVALLRAAGSPGGRGLAFTGGGLLVLASLVTGGWEVWMWFRFSDLFVSFSQTVSMPLLMPPSVPLTYHAVVSLLLAAAVVFLLFGVLSARRHKHAAHTGAGRRPGVPHQQAGPGQPAPSGPGHRPGQPHTPAPGRPPAAPPGYGQRPSRRGYGPTGASGPYGDASGGSDSGGGGGSNGAGGHSGGGSDGGGGGGGF
ncbi:hypothetical protein CQJ94_19275 [Glycomyces fuscus]|nr:hypothetical protein CQJ94_19275 [Glycomyces fuscus]